MLRGKLVIDRHHDASRRAGQYPAYDVVRVEIAGDPSAAMEKSHRRKFSGAARTIDADGNLARGAGDTPVLDARNGLSRAGICARADRLAHFLDAQGVKRRAAHRGGLVEYRLHLRVEWHYGQAPPRRGRGGRAISRARP